MIEQKHCGAGRAQNASSISMQTCSASTLVQRGEAYKRLEVIGIQRALGLGLKLPKKPPGGSSEAREEGGKVTDETRTPRVIPPEHEGIDAYAYEDLWDYHLGVAGEGPHAYNWSDKPHRLVYDLTRICAEERRSLAAKSAECDGLREDAERWRFAVARVRHKDVHMGTTYRQWIYSSTDSISDSFTLTIDAARREGG